MGCKHKHGDHIKAIGMWVCGQCYHKLESRPKRYVMVPSSQLALAGGEKGGAPAMRQEIAWQSEIIKSQAGTTLNTFLAAIVRRFMSRFKDLSVSDAYTLAIGAVEGQGVEFGHVDYCWDRAGAIDIADEDMQYWDGDSPESNG